MGWDGIGIFYTLPRCVLRGGEVLVAVGGWDGEGIGGALEVWPWTFGSRTAWLVKKTAGQPQFWVAAGGDKLR